MRRTLSVTFQASRSLRGEHYRIHLTMLIDVHLRSTSHSGHTFSRRFAGALRSGQRGRAGHSSSDSTSRSTKRHIIECAAAESHGLDILSLSRSRAGLPRTSCRNRPPWWLMVASSGTMQNQ